jgi:hypothetical protein
MKLDLLALGALVAAAHLLGRIAMWLMVNELVCLLHVVTRWLVYRAARRLPGAAADRWQEEWLCHLLEYRERPLAALLFALDTFRAARRVGAESALPDQGEHASEPVPPDIDSAAEDLAAVTALLRELRHFADQEYHRIVASVQPHVRLLEDDANRASSLQKREDLRCRARALYAHAHERALRRRNEVLSQHDEAHQVLVPQTQAPVSSAWSRRTVSSWFVRLFTGGPLRKRVRRNGLRR